MRLVTRGNFDGLSCAVLITEAESVESIVLIHPQDITDGRFTATRDDILANLPHATGCAKWFDHHAATRAYEKPPESFDGKYGLAPSTARLVYDYYRVPKPELRKFDALIRETDRFDSARLTREDVLDPKGYILLGFTLDPRTGLGAFEDYFRLLVPLIKQHSVEELLKQPKVHARVERISKERGEFLEALKRHSRLIGTVVVTDLRDAEHVPAGNRFLIYTLFPEANVSLRIAWGPERKFLVATVGHSIFNTSCSVHVGHLMAKYGGGGHVGAGATPLPIEGADLQIERMVKQLTGLVVV